MAHSSLIPHPSSLSSVLVANRGEIAVRICRTLREMGVRSVVVASIPDRRSLAVRSADSWVLLEGYTAAETYLDVEAVIAAAKAEGCDAIHPGYGFLSERADFAERCAAEGIVFVGPPPAVLRALGDKAAARRLAVEAGVPVVPGYDGPDGDEALLAAARDLGPPLMVKARGGGGGRGMREVHDLAELPEALASARREAQAAFGDPGLLLEKLITDAHHVEVQVLADQHGNFVHLGERDCSVQRRRQKLIEETPSPVVDAALREELTDAALRIARAANYVNAGTVEFLVETPAGGKPTGFYFLEVNPRLQVEHPVTEMVTGLNLVELQLRVAVGEPLPVRQEDVKFEGHAIEFRINAEDPWEDFRPSVGRAGEELRTARFLPEAESPRTDSGIEGGDSVSGFYDSLLLKVVYHRPTREETLAEAASGIGGVEGLRTNHELLRRVAADPAFAAGRAGIGLLERELPRLLGLAPVGKEKVAAAVLGLMLVTHPYPPRGREGPFARNTAWIGAGSVRLWLSDGRMFYEAEVESVDRHEARVRVNGEPYTCTWRSPELKGLRVNGTPLEASFDYFDVQSIEVRDRAGPHRIFVVPPPPLPRRAHAAVEGAAVVAAPLAGTVAAVHCAEGDSVEAGQLVVTIEAMKMEHRVTATSPGTIRRVAVAPRDVVREGDVLVEVE
jgi:acetyl/propionyl-CoA carboxylase alpha subunit